MRASPPIVRVLSCRLVAGVDLVEVPPQVHDDVVQEHAVVAVADVAADKLAEADPAGALDHPRLAVGRGGAPVEHPVPEVVPEQRVLVIDEARCLDAVGQPVADLVSDDGDAETRTAGVAGVERQLDRGPSVDLGDTDQCVGDISVEAIGGEHVVDRDAPVVVAVVVGHPVGQCDKPQASRGDHGQTEQCRDERPERAVKHEAVR